MLVAVRSAKRFGNQHFGRLANQFVAREAKEPLGLLVNQNNHAGRIDDDNGVRRRLEQSAIVYAGPFVFSDERRRHDGAGIASVGDERLGRSWLHNGVHSMVNGAGFQPIDGYRLRQRTCRRFFAGLNNSPDVAIWMMHTKLVRQSRTLASQQAIKFEHSAVQTEGVMTTRNRQRMLPYFAGGSLNREISARFGTDRQNYSGSGTAVVLAVKMKRQKADT